jgi:hypothetical protein
MSEVFKEPVVARITDVREKVADTLNKARLAEERARSEVRAWEDVLDQLDEVRELGRSDRAVFHLSQGVMTLTVAGECDGKPLAFVTVELTGEGEAVSA